MRKLLYGVGINDADYTFRILEYFVVDGKRKRVETWTCPYYVRWKGMLARCYSDVRTRRQQSYMGCSVCEDWLTFSKFKSWMETQDWEGKQLDKDILVPGNRVYSDKTCVFVSSLVNAFFLNKNRANRGAFPVGVSFDKNRNKFVAKCNQLDNTTKNLGRFENYEDAHLAWRKEKQRLANILAERETNQFVKQRLLNLFELEVQ